MDELLQGNLAQVERRLPVKRKPSKPKTKKPHKLAPWLNRMTCGDSLKVLHEIPEKSVRLVVTSPPYNIKNSTGNGLKDGRGGKWSKARLIDATDGRTQFDFVGKAAQAGSTIYIDDHAGYRGG